MDREDRLNTLLSARHAAGEHAYELARLPLEDAELALLLSADRRLAPLRGATPAADFADALEQRLLVHAGALVAQRASAAAQDAPTIVGSDYPTLPSGYSNGVSSAYEGDAAPTRPDLTQPAAGEWLLAGTRTSPPRRAARVLRFPSVGTWTRSIAAAVILLVLGASVLSAAANAAPGSFLFGLRRAEQWFSVQVTNDPAARVRLHLQYAEQALAALDAAVAHKAGSPAYADALGTLRAEVAAASEGIGSLTPGPARDDLAAQLATFQRDARGELRAALPGLNWPDRLATTAALGELGDESVPRIGTVTVRPESSSGDHGGDVHGGNGDSGGDHGDGAAGIRYYRVEISGSGFAAGAALMVNGKAAGTVLSVTPSVLVAEVALKPSALHNVSFGVQNPDGTATATSSVTHGAPVVVPTVTATPDDHGGHGGHSGDGSGSGSGG